jgi:hypothetical protein
MSESEKSVVVDIHKPNEMKSERSINSAIDTYQTTFEAYQLRPFGDFFDTTKFG